MRNTNCLCALAGVIMLAGCSSTPTKQPSTTASTNDARRISAEQRASLYEDLQSNTTDLAGIFDNIDAAPPESPRDPGLRARDAKPRKGELLITEGSPPEVPAEAYAAANAEEPSGEAPVQPDRDDDVEPFIDPLGERMDLVVRLAELLGESDVSHVDPIRAALDALALEALEPGSAEPELAAIRDRLSPPEVIMVDELRQLVEQLRANTDMDQITLSRLLRERADALPEATQLTLSRFTLCTDVEGFGQYVPFATNQFEAGRAHTVLVYTEIEDFAQRRRQRADRDRVPGTENLEQWEVSVGQQISIIHDKDGLPAMQVPEELATDWAFRQRSDFYLVRTLVLPENLSIGRYRVKVTVRDKVHGRAMAEASLPIEVVAKISRGR